ncbi:MAG: hypothetical protein LBE80_10685 [Deltaproteobacteria bacterium]|nr:hypothetical protein [Deltaproteobacteria bacterium]
MSRPARPQAAAQAAQAAQAASQTAQAPQPWPQRGHDLMAPFDQNGPGLVCLARARN